MSSNNKRKKSGKKVKKSDKGEEKKPVETVESLTAKANEALDRLSPGEAVPFLEQALQLRPNDTATLDLLGHANMELGNVDAAVEALRKSTSLRPEENFTKWMCLGQLLEGLEALSCYEKGVALMNKELERLEAHPDDEDEEWVNSKIILSHQISSGYCSMVELFTTDCCDEPNAETECERLLTLAETKCNWNPEVFQAKTNLRLIQGRLDEANESLTQCIMLMRNDEDEGDEGEDEKDEVDKWRGEEEGVTHDVKVSVAKMAFELQRYDEASRLLENILHEDDRDPEMWLLSGTCYRHLEEFTTAHEYLNSALGRYQQAADTEGVRLVEAELLQLPESAAQVEKHGLEDDEEKEDEGDAEAEDGEEDAEMD